MAYEMRFQIIICDDTGHTRPAEVAVYLKSLRLKTPCDYRYMADNFAKDRVKKHMEKNDCDVFIVCADMSAPSAYLARLLQYDTEASAHRFLFIAPETDIATAFKSFTGWAL